LLQAAQPHIPVAVESSLSESEINKYLRTINLQIEVLKFAGAQNKGGGLATQLLALSLFASQKQKAELAEQVLIAYNFDLAFKIVQDFRLPVVHIYNNGIAIITRRKQLAKVNEALRMIKVTMDDNEEWDQLVLTVVNILAKELGDKEAAEKYITKLENQDNAVSALITCGKLKTAYLAAAKTGRLDQMKQIQLESEKADNRTVSQLCANYLTQYSGGR
jgi:hypothetical protein